MGTVEIINLEKNFGHHHVLRDINLSIAEGEFVVLVGPSGCGKSTLLKSIAGLENQSSGRIEIAGRDVSHADPGDRSIAMVFQSYALYPHMTVAENMGFGLRIAKRPKQEIDQAVQRAARILRLEEHLDKLPKALSGGQRQRVAIGRAITRSPAVFLFDEPLSNLDAALRTQMRVEIASLHRELGATMVYVTHDQVEAMTMADRIVVLQAGQIEQVGAPRMNFLAAHVKDGRVNAVGLPPMDLPSTRPLVEGEEVTLGLRPEAIRLDQGDIQLSARVKHVERLGRETLLYADAAPCQTIESEGGNATFTVQAAATLDVSLDEAVTLQFETDDLMMFAKDGARLSPDRAITGTKR